MSNIKNNIKNKQPLSQLGRSQQKKTSKQKQKQNNPKTKTHKRKSLKLHHPLLETLNQNLKQENKSGKLGFS